MSEDRPVHWFRRFYRTCYELYVVITVLGAVAMAIRGIINAIATVWSKHQSWREVLFSLGFRLGPRTDTWFSICVAAIVGSIIAACSVVLIGSYVIRAFWKRKKKGKNSWWQNWKDAVAEAYEGNQFVYLAFVQAGLRAAVALFVMTPALASLMRRHLPDSPASIPLVEKMNAGHIFLACGYLVVTLGGFLLGRRQFAKLSEQFADSQVFNEKISRLFWISAAWDLWFVTLIWITTILPHRPFYLAYIVPIMGTWLILGERARRAFILVFSGLLGHFTFATWTFMSHPELARRAGYGNGAPLILLWELLPLLAFWLTLALILRLLRHLRSHQQEAMLRRALETLGAEQGHAVFVKNTRRRFVFGNEVFLRSLENKAIQNNWPRPKNRVTMEQILHKTDHELDIERPEYRKSDEQVLNSPAKETDCFEGFEPPYDPDQSAPIWTRKQAVRNDAGKVIGLVGFVVSGMPVEMQKIADFLSNRLPVYASMKDREGHVIWANARHLAKLEPSIDDLLRQQGLAGLLDKPVQVKLKAINAGRGPRDHQIYGPAGQDYANRDTEIMQAAEVFEGPTDDFKEVMETLIMRWYQCPRDGVFPESGWMEHHVFPKGGEKRWVEVWKMPWWEESFPQGKSERKVRGILVFFTDNNTKYLRKCVVSRWVTRRLPEAHKSNTELIEKISSANPVDPKLPALKEFRLLELLCKSLYCFKALAEGAAGAIDLGGRRRTASDLEPLFQVLERWFDPIKISFEAPRQSMEFAKYGDTLFAAIVQLVMNAMESTWRSHIGHPPAVVVRLRSSETEIIVDIIDRGQITAEEARQIHEMDRLNAEDHMPGGGFFLAKGLLSRLSPPGTLAIAARGDHPGARVTIHVPLSAFA